MASFNRSKSSVLRVGVPGKMKVYGERGRLVVEKETDSAAAMRRKLEPGERLVFVPEEDRGSVVVRRCPVSA